MDLSSKKVLFAGWGAENQADTYMYQIWRYTLQNIFKNFIVFDTKENYFRYGKEAMNNALSELVKKEKPDCIIFAFFNDEFYPETFDEIKKIAPQSKTVIISCDEDLKFENFYKFMSLFFDYHIISQKPVISKYKRDKIKNLFFHMDFNTYGLKPLHIEKKYDVTFIGRPKADRAEILEYLADNGINLELYGWDWYNYPKLRKFYRGFLNAEDYNRIMNETRINLCLTKAGYEGESGLYNLKGKTFEIALAGAFQLLEYFKPIFEFFDEGKELISFKTKEELLEKVKYYLEHEKEREKIADNSYKKITKTYNRETDLKKTFDAIFKKNNPQKPPKINKKIISLSKEDLLEEEKLREKIKDYDYICFKNENCEISPYREYIQAYSLEKSDKTISCSDYYVYSKRIGNIILFRGDWAFRRTGEEFHKLLDISQLMATKEFFLQNLNSFRDLFENKPFKLINKENTIFVSIPLIRIKKLRTISYENMKKAFEVRYLEPLLSLLYQKKLFTSSYLYKMIFESFYKPFMLRYLLNSIFNKSNWDKLVLNQKYMENSFLKNFLKKF